MKDSTNTEVWSWSKLLSNQRIFDSDENDRSAKLSNLANAYLPGKSDFFPPLPSSPSSLKMKLKNDNSDKNAPSDDDKQAYPFSIFDDNNRIVSSSAFRRLQNKTQVYPLEKHDYVRTRLTHSIEVSCLAENILRNARELKKIEDASFLRNFDQILCCVRNGGLLHDIGNPPFGHYGEDALKNYFKINWEKLVFYEDKDLLVLNGDSSEMLKDSDTVKGKKFVEIITREEQEYTDFSCFDGNAQAFRIINSTQPFVGGNGLNLTLATLASIIKYPNDSKHITNDHAKFGFFKSETNIIEELTKKRCYFEGKKNPIALIMEAADDVSNLINDFIDAIKKNKITQSDIIGFIKRYRRDPFLSSLDFDSNTKNLFQEVSEKTETLKQFLIKAVAYEFASNYLKIMQGDYEGTLIENCCKTKKVINAPTPEISPNQPTSIASSKNDLFITDIMNDFFKTYVYNNCEIVSLELQGERIIWFLLEHFLKAVMEVKITSAWKEKAKTKNQKILQLLSEDYVKVYVEAINKNSDSKSVLYNKIHLIVDHICGMTDEYAKETYKTIMGII